MENKIMDIQYKREYELNPYMKGYFHRTYVSITKDKEPKKWELLEQDYIDTKEKAHREALIELGWIPPREKE